MVFRGFNAKVHNSKYQPEKDDIAASAMLDVYSFNTENTETFKAQPTYFIRKNQEFQIADTVSPLSLYVRLTKIIPSEEKALIEYKQPDALNDYIIMKAILFPFINVLWIGAVIMLFGFGLSFYKRFKQK